MKNYKTKKHLKTSKDIREYASKKKEKEFIIPYKGGHGVVKNGRITNIYVGKDSLKKAKQHK